MSERGWPAAEDGAFRQLIENVAAGVSILQDARIVYANRGRPRCWAGRRPRSRARIRPRCWSRRTARPAESFAALVSGRIDEDYTEYRVALPDGRVRHLAVSCARTDWRAGPPCCACCTHSRQRAATAALRGSEERYRTMVESLNQAL